MNMTYILERAAEPSTWGGVAAAAAALSANTQGTVSAVAGGIAAVASALAIYLKEQHAPPPPSAAQ